jgi:hypothetical protein
MIHFSRRELLAIIAHLVEQSNNEEPTNIDVHLLIERARYLICIAKAHNVTIDDPPELIDLSSIAALQTFVVKSELALRRENVDF